jgi:putative zinc finger/helix-turn-helix YgiT family protein
MEDRKKMKCLTCGEPTKSRKENYHYKESGLPNIVLVGVEVRTCASCGAREVVVPRLDELHRTIAKTLVTKDAKLGAAQIRFLRKYLGWSSADFATYMAVQPETVSRWEAGTQEMGPVSERLLRLLVANRGPVTEYPIDLFRQKMRRVAKATLKFRAEPNWHTEDVA